MGTLTVRLQNVVLQIKTAHEDFLVHAREHFSHQVIPDQEYADVQVVLDYRTGLRRHHEAFRFDGPADRILIGYNTFLSTDSIDWNNIWDFPGLKLSHRKEKSRHFYHVVYHEMEDDHLPLRLAKRILRRRARKAHQDDILDQFLEYLVYYPIFWFLEYERGLHLCHASGVELQRGAVIFPGLAGVGKSTVSMYLFSRMGGRLLSDNLLFYDDKKVYACLEPILLASYGQRLLERGDPRVIATGRSSVYDRNAFLIPEEHRSNEAKLGLVILLVRSKSAFVRRVSKEYALSRTLDANAIAGETKRYHTYSAMMNLLTPRSILTLRRAQTLATILAGAECYEAGMPDGVSAEGDLDAAFLQELEKLPIA